MIFAANKKIAISKVIYVKMVMGFMIALFLAVTVSAAIEVEPMVLSNLKSASGSAYAVEPAKDYVLLYFWATWCPDCKEKLKGPLREALELKNTSFLAVNTEKDKDMVFNFSERENIKVPIYMDVAKEVRKSLKVFSVPQWVLLKKNKEKFDIVASEVEFDIQKIRNLMSN